MPTTAATAMTAAMTTATAMPRRDRSRAPIPDSLPMSAGLHQVGQTQVLAGNQPVVLIERDPVPAEHRPHDVEGLTQAVQSHAPAFGVGRQRVTDVFETLGDRHDVFAVPHREPVED